MFERIKECEFFLNQQAKPIVTKLEMLVEHGENPEQAQKTLNWLNKKAISHLKENITDAENLAGDEAFLADMVNAGISPEEAKNKLLLITVLHDVGHFKEVDAQKGVIKLKFDHALASYEMLKQAGLKDTAILLTVKYHGVLDAQKSLGEDAEFKALPLQSQTEILALSKAIRDIDKITNIREKTKTGVIGCSEETTFPNDYRISKPVIDALENRRQVANNDRVNWIDGVLRFAAWGYDLNYPTAQKMFSKDVINDFFARTHEYADRHRKENPSDNGYAACSQELTRLNKLMLRQFGYERGNNSQKPTPRVRLERTHE